MRKAAPRSFCSSTVLITLLTLLSGGGSIALAADPPEPTNPKSTKECAALGRAFDKEWSDLHGRLSRAPTRGQQVQAGPCCAAENPGNALWCRTHESSAPIWEEIHCLEIRRRQAVSRCMAKASIPKREIPHHDLAYEEIFDHLKALDRVREALPRDSSALLERYREARRWYVRAAALPYLLQRAELATTRTSQGLPIGEPTDLNRFATSRLSPLHLRNPLVRQLVEDNLTSIGVFNANVERVFATVAHHVIEQSNIADTSVPSGSGPATALPSNAGRSDCKTRREQLIADCARSIHRQGDFIAFDKCRQQIDLTHPPC